MFIQVTDLSFAYSDGEDVLRGVTLDIEAGESVALVGPSGSGKSTLLALVGGLVRPTAGTVMWNGARPTVLGAPKVAWVQQTVNVIGRRTALDNVMLGLYARGVHWLEAEARASAMLEAMGLGHRQGVRARELSGGELQRVVVARALVAEAELLLADEPTGQLDATNSEMVVGWLLHGRSPGTTAVVATHDPAVAQRCDRVVTLRDGVLA